MSDLLDKAVANYHEAWAKHNAMQRNPRFEYEDPVKALERKLALQSEQDRKSRESTEAFRKSMRDMNKGRRLEYDQ